jgi:hypothetical protein
MSMQTDSLSQKTGWVLLVMAISAYMLLSASMLLRIGIPYDAPFGPPIAKIHPGTYLLFLAWFFTLSSHGNPLLVLAHQMARRKLISVYLMCMLVVFVWAVFRHGSSGAAFIIESLWTPAIVVFVMDLIDERRQRQVVQLVVFLLLCNALLAVGEALTPQRLTPLHVGRNDIVAEEYFRASAFLGHPLHNALITASLLPAITLLPWSRPAKLLFVGTLMMALLAFGGRTSFALVVLIYGSYFAWRVVVSVIHGRFSYLQITGGSLSLMLGATGLLGVVAVTGLGERIFKNLTLDSSASVRLRVWDAFNYLSDTDYWMGIAPVDIDHIAIRMGLDPTYEAIENFWIYLFLQFGVIGFVPFMVGIACLTVFLLKTATPSMRLAVLLYFLVASTANTLASKTVSLMLLAMVIMASAAFRARPSTPIHGNTR